ncbi:hypothetical protein PHMEG_00014480 [Phytophthora megakarya]|uniref:Uncharacterized protein n=1 Tax=Phytophthora megakarya TaxID=4795 RepID=A0A225W484_9STRA|nr:hypothetical protein PHMEG_00014480 [Phytophthora megakarya]
MENPKRTQKEGREGDRQEVEDLRRFVSNSRTVFETVNGDVTSNGTTVMKLEKLNCSAKIKHRFEVVEHSPDAMVLGWDLMSGLGLVLNFKDKFVQGEDYSVSVNTERKGSLESVNDDDVEFADESKELLSEDLTAALAPRYLELLKTNQHLYDGHLGRMQFPDYVLSLSPDYVPVHAKPYAVARRMESKAKDTILKLIKEDVIEQIYDLEVASPVFCLAKKNGDLR